MELEYLNEWIQGMVLIVLIIYSTILNKLALFEIIAVLFGVTSNFIIKIILSKKK